MTRFEEYLERFCKLYGLTSEEAMQLKIVQEVKLSHEEEAQLNPRK